MNLIQIRSILNIILMGIAFLLLFSAFQTSSMFQTIVLNSAKNEPNSTFTGSGYISLTLIYLVFAFVNWFSPVVVVWLTPKYSMFVSAILYVLFIASFLKPMNWSLYLGSVLVGLAAGVLWTAQGNFLSINSNPSTINRNTTLFWSIFQTSLVLGNLFQFLMFRQSYTISHVQRTIFYTVFTAIGGLGALLMLSFQKPVETIFKSQESLSENDLKTLIPEKYNPKNAFFQSFRLVRTTNMLLLQFVFIYAGLELTFFSGVYGTAVGQTEYFGDSAKGYVGLIGIMIGLGEITSSVIFNILPRIFKNLAPDFIVICGLFVHIISFYLIFLSLPFDSTRGSSSGFTYITPRASVVILCGFMLGFGDGIFNIQIMALLGNTYKGLDNPSAFAIFYFVRSLASAAGFFYSIYLSMQWQLLILSITGVIGTISFIYIEQKTRLTILTPNVQASVIQN